MQVGSAAAGLSAPMFPCSFGPMFPCSFWSMLPCSFGSMLPCSFWSILPCSFGSMFPCFTARRNWCRSDNPIFVKTLCGRCLLRILTGGHVGMYGLAVVGLGWPPLPNSPLVCNLLQMLRAWDGRRSGCHNSARLVSKEKQAFAFAASAKAIRSPWPLPKKSCS